MLKTFIRGALKVLEMSWITIIGFFMLVLFIVFFAEIVSFVRSVLNGTRGWSDVDWALVVLLLFVFGPFPCGLVRRFIKKK